MDLLRHSKIRPRRGRSILFWEGIRRGMHLVALAPGGGIAGGTAAVPGRAAAGADRTFCLRLRAGAGLLACGAALRIELLVAAARRTALHIAAALCAAADICVGCDALRQHGAGKHG